jgi:hypothetical protein
LYWTALLIDSVLNQMTLGCGSFHMNIGFLGTTGHVMIGLRLQKLLKFVYATDPVSNMLSGKAISEAVFGHLLVNAAPNAILVANAYNVPVPDKDITEPIGNKFVQICYIKNHLIGAWSFLFHEKNM